MLRASVATVAAVLTAASTMAQAPAGPEFRVNSYTTSSQSGPATAIDRNGELTIAWSSADQDGSGTGVYARRYAETGANLGGEFLVPTLTAGNQKDASVAYGMTGSVIAWRGSAAGDVRARRYARGGTPRGGEFAVNTSTTGDAYAPRVAALAGGGFAVAWQRQSPSSAVVARSFDAFGVPRGAEVAYSPGGPTFSGPPAIAAGGNGRFVIVWEATPAASYHGILGRLFNADGSPIGSDFLASEFPLGGSETRPDVAMAADGSFVVVWQHFGSTPDDIMGRRFSPDGVPIGGQFVLDQATTDSHSPMVSADRSGNFVVVWSTGFGTSYDLMARRFTADGVPRTGDFAVNAYTTGRQSLADVASDDVGNFVVSWTGPDAAGAYDSFARRFGGVRPASLAVDPSASSQSDGNRVLEPGETVTVQPSWRNVSAAVVGISGTIPSFTGPAGAVYGIVDDFALYGTVAPGAAATCSDCFTLSVSAPNPRPAAHWDAVAKEEIAPAAQGQRKLWTIHVGNSFSDVPRTSPFYRSIETLLHHSVTSGCGGAQFCPQAATTREQMAVFVVVARDAAGDPPPACGTPMFADVPASSPFCRWIEELARSGVVSGCGGGSYCPSAAVSREQMAVFVLRAFDDTLQPPACTTPVFADVPASSPFCRWIEELARRGVVSGCGGGNFCPQDAVTREQMAVFIGATLGLQLYGP